MNIPTIASLKELFRDQHDISLHPLPRKKVMYQGDSRGGRRVVVAMPASKIHQAGYGWVDMTAKQRLQLQYSDVALVVFRLADGHWYVVDFERLNAMITDDAADYSDRAGKHWKMRLWPNKLEMMRGGAAVNWHANDATRIAAILHS